MSISEAEPGRARGRKGGRKPVVTPEIVRKARVLIAQGLNVREAAARLRVGKTALYEALATKPTDMHKHTAIRAAPSGLKVTAM